MSVRMTMMAGAALLALAACDRGAPEGEAGTEAAAGDSAAAPAAGGDAVAAAPRIRAGLWQVTTAIEGVGAAPTTRMCVDEQVQEEMSVFGQSDPRCRQTRLERRADGSTAFASECDMGSAGRTTLEGSASGDFQTRYETRATVTTTGAELAQMNQAMTMTSVAVWQGPCPAGWAAGDVETPAGRMNMLEMQRQAAAAEG